MRKLFELLCVLELLCIFVIIPTTSHAAPPAMNQKFEILALSGRPDMVTGGSVLVRVNVPPKAALEQIAIKLNGQDVTPELHPNSTAHNLTGVATDLKIGANLLEVFNGPGDKVAELALKNYPITGPVFSGPQEHPFVCQTQDFKLPDGATLGPPLDANCSAKTVITYIYKSTAQPAEGHSERRGPVGMKPLPSLTELPPDVAYTTISTGEKVPYIVRVETGTINRGIYQIAVLHDPTKEPEPSPLTPLNGWNGRLLYTFGPGCPGGWLKQGTSIGAGGVINDNIVGKGYAEASSTLNVFGNNCNDVLAAETMMMVKEHFIKSYGKPLFTMSRGGSGGSEQQVPIADNYPGLIDGIMPSRTFPDVLANAQMILDANLLNVYYAKTGDTLTTDQKLAIEGTARLKDFAEDAARVSPTGECPKQLPKAERYDAVSNRSGARCDVFDHTINAYGRDPETGFARRPVDNIGVQYGLQVLNAGKITVDQFLDLNQNIGGYDNDGNVVSARSVADPIALQNAYATGRVVNGGLGLGKIPIIDNRPYRDMLPNGDVHLKYYSFALRDRLQKANGTFANDVILVGPDPYIDKMDEYAVEKMDEWLTNLSKDTSKDSTIAKIKRAKPADLVDLCFGSDGERIVEPQTPTGGKCNELYPTFESPRMVAGGPVANDVLKCELKPVDFKDYKVAFSEAEKARLTSIFPNGVCNWKKPGIDQKAPNDTWASY